uniref:C2H2-type domain-containing protein n=1 Tax=Coccidioides posadasii RMSCC 3488 TaxID=454284 RepID=A0A0J6EUS6_COCPO|nr:hypothetical protein CPAG_00638 [Coccidioides posadasii RMSCC 3488]
MSTLQRSENNSAPFTAFKPDHFDPFLSHPASSEEQLVPIDSHNLLFGGSAPQTHNTQQQQQHHHHHHSTDNRTYASPTDGTSPYDASSHLGHASGLSSPTFLSPGSMTHETGQSDVSGHPSPGTENHWHDDDDRSHLPSGFGDCQQLYINPEVFGLPSLPGKSTQHGNHVGHVNRTLNTNQLLSPVLTNTPSPSTVFNHQPGDVTVSPDQLTTAISPTSFTNQKQRDLPTLRLPALATTPCSDDFEINNPNHPGPPSPVVKISSYSRGDSPSRDEAPLNQSRRTRSVSSSHLAPGDNASVESEGEDDDDFNGDNDVDNDRRPASRSSPSSPTLRAADGSWLPNPSTGLGGLDPSSRTDEYVPSLKEVIAQREIEEKNADVERWLSVSEANSEVEDNSLFGFQQQKKWRLRGRHRTKSMGDSPLSPRNAIGPSQQGFDVPASRVPETSPIHEESEVGDPHTADTSSWQSPGSVGPTPQIDSQDEFSAPTENDSISNEEPLPSQFIRARPWKDPPRNPRYGDMKEQPPTSSAAMYLFMRKADNTDAASRRATWGTRDVTEADVESLRFESMRINDDSVKEKISRSSILEHASKLLPRRHHSSSKRKHISLAQQTQPSMESVETGKSSSSSSVPPQRKPSFTRRSRTPSHTGGALLEMGRQIASVGVGGPVGIQPVKSNGPWSSLIRRNRSGSDVPKVLQKPLSGRAPVFTPEKSPVNRNHADENDGDHEATANEIDFGDHAELRAPTLEGFKNHVQRLFPQLQPTLVDRIGQEQLRRYQKLVELRLRHAQAVKRRACKSGEHCFAQGGGPTILPPRMNPKDSETTYPQLQISGTGAGDDDANGGAAGENATLEAMSSKGIPPPPAKQLPARFECSLCFEVKEFQKPSDWTKHVHEDVQPFTCTFPECTEPKSFKRKADWVRHENETHRHLEWWECNMEDCTHICYRKNNFVQHLVREHKMPEPRMNRVRARGGQNDGAPPNMTDPDIPLQDILVDRCHRKTKKQPTQEACRFCGETCNSWKKLAAHMADHMEQIALPVLKLVEKTTTFPSAMVSPIEDAGSSPAQSNVTTPIEGYSTPIQRTSSSNQQENRSKGKAGRQRAMYGTAALLPEAFAVKQPPVSSQQLQMHNVLYGVSGQQPYSMPAHHMRQSYSLGNLPVMQGDYTALPTMQGQDGRGEMATYPPFSTQPRHSGDMPYNLDVSASAVSMMGLTGGQIYASPVEHIQYSEEQGGMGYSDSSSPGMGYPMEATGSGQGFVFPGGQYGH